MTVMTAAPVIWPPAPKTQRESARARYPARPVTMAWPATRRAREDVWQELVSPPFVLGNIGSQGKRIRGLTRMLDWLQDQPGETWQEHWLAAGAEAAGADWRQVPMRWLGEHRRRSQWLPAELNEALRVAICADLVRPSLTWLMSVAAIKGTLARHLAQTRDPEGFARLEAQCDSHRASQRWHDGAPCIEAR